MAIGVFDSKNFNTEVFAAYMNTIPRVKKTELLRSGVFAMNSDWATRFANQAGGNYIIEPMTGRVSGDPVKYDGATDITATKLDTYSRGVVAAGFAKGFTEKDFTESITGKDFMTEAASQVSEYWDDAWQKYLLNILDGIFSMTNALDTPFVTNHTTDISSGTGDAAMVGPTTLNSAIQKACGDNKNAFSVAIMHSTVATNLENQELLKFWVQTDANGIQRQLNLASWNGKTVLIDDSMPVESGDYTTYLLGAGAFDYCPLPVKVAYEMDRDPATNGGETTLYTRDRAIYAPVGFSFTKTTMASNSPDFSEMALPANWELARNSGDTAVYPHKAIPIARIISKG